MLRASLLSGNLFRVALSGQYCYPINPERLSRLGGRVLRLHSDGVTDKFVCRQGSMAVEGKTSFRFRREMQRHHVGELSEDSFRQAFSMGGQVQ